MTIDNTIPKTVQPTVLDVRNWHWKYSSVCHHSNALIKENSSEAYRGLGKWWQGKNVFDMKSDLWQLHIFLHLAPLYQRKSDGERTRATTTDALDSLAPPLMFRSAFYHSATQKCVKSTIANCRRCSGPVTVTARTVRHADLCFNIAKPHYDIFLLFSSTNV